MPLELDVSRRDLVAMIDGAAAESGLPADMQDKLKVFARETPAASFGDAVVEGVDCPYQAIMRDYKSSDRPFDLEDILVGGFKFVAGFATRIESQHPDATGAIIHGEGGVLHVVEE
jgi:hypothetical protein